jgi:PIN domain nuclease of toxin-antitoxin system
VRVLLDTHAVLWFMLDDAKLSRGAAELIAEPVNDCLISPASHWEMAIKISVGKYRITHDFESLWRDALDQFAVLPIELRHTARLLSLPFHHKDPFDRLIVAQALCEAIPVVSGDTTFDAYGINRLW